MAKVIQSDLSGGEVSPTIASRTDIEVYRKSLALCENFFVRAQGGILNRAGLQLSAEVKDSTQEVRLEGFEFNTTQTYILEIGDQYMRFHTGGGLVLDSSYTKTITGATQASPVVITTSASHGLTTGDEVYITGVVGMTQLNKRQFKVTSLTATTFSLQLMDGTTNVDGTGYTAYSSAGSVDIPYEIATPYVEADIGQLSFVQSADVATVTHPLYAPRELSRLGNDNWTLTEIVFQPQQASAVSFGTRYRSSGCRWRRSSAMSSSSLRSVSSSSSE